MLTCCLLIFTAATAQSRRHGLESGHELSVYGLGGYSPVRLTLDGSVPTGGGSISGSMGGGVGFGYTFNINSSIGIVTGVEMALYGAEFIFPPLGVASSLRAEFSEEITPRQS